MVQTMNKWSTDRALQFQVKVSIRLGDCRLCDIGHTNGTRLREMLYSSRLLFARGVRQCEIEKRQRRREPD